MATPTYINPQVLAKGSSSYDGDLPANTVDRKLSQAHALSIFLMGTQSDLREYSEAVQSSMAWLMSDLIEDAMSALDAERAERKRQAA